MEELMSRINNSNNADLKEIAEKLYQELQYEVPTESELDKVVSVALSCISNHVEGNPGFRLLEQAAIKGSAKAQYTIGWFYYAGECVEKDLKKAYDWFKQSAEQGYDDAINNLGECYLHGYGCETDKAKGYELIKKAADRYNTYAFEGMGYCYYFGAGTERDLDKAKYWWQKAAAFGNQLGHEKLIQYFGYDSEKLSIVPYEILKNGFNSTNFDQFICSLGEDVVFESFVRDEKITGVSNVIKHLSSTADRVRENNVVMRASVAEIVNSEHPSPLTEDRKSGDYCIWLETMYGNATVLMEGNDTSIERICICKSDMVKCNPLNTYDTMTRQEIHEFGLDIVCTFLEEEKYKILMCNRKYKAYPQILAMREGTRHMIVVKTEIAPFTGRLDEGLYQFILNYARDYNAEPSFASVGIGSSKAELFNNSIAIRNDGFYVRFEGLEMLRTKQIH